jgi:hypothetical protein
MLAPLHGEYSERIRLVVTFDAGQFERIGPWEAEVLVAFRLLYGGINSILSSVDWNLEGLHELARENFSQLGGDEEDEEGELEKVRKMRLLFNVSVLDSDGTLFDRAVLAWQYRTDGPAAATLLNLKAEHACLASGGLGEQAGESPRRLRIPIYSTCPKAEDVGDLDLSRPVTTLGAWYRDAADLGGLLREELKPRARPESWSTVEKALDQLELAWGSFIASAVNNGLFASGLDGLLDAYNGLLESAATSLQQGQEVLGGFRLLTQSWIVGPKSFDEWAVVPLLHPLKLHWWRERARRFQYFIARLIDLPNGPVTIVDEKRFRQELVNAYCSAGFPAVLALPGRQRRPDYFLPVNEVGGYELFRWIGQAGLAYGFNPELVTEEESARDPAFST